MPESSTATFRNKFANFSPLFPSFMPPAKKQDALSVLLFCLFQLFFVDQLLKDGQTLLDHLVADTSGQAEIIGAAEIITGNDQQIVTLCLQVLKHVFRPRQHRRFYKDVRLF